MEIAVEYEKKVKETRSIQIPSYVKGGSSYYKVISDKECVCIQPEGILGAEIQVRPISFAVQFGTEQSSGEEFTAAFNSAIQTFNNKLK